MDQVVLGLGNPGPKYEGTRHNAGFMATGELARRHDIRLSRSGHRSLWGNGLVGRKKVLVAHPQTYMNLSGQAARALLDYFDLEPRDLVVVYDEMDLPLGRIKIVTKGGPGNHKGMASVIADLGTPEITRLKIGIGRPRYGEDGARYVLEGFYADQRELVARVVEAAADCLEVLVTQGAGEAMQIFHSLQLSEEEEG